MPEIVQEVKKVGGSLMVRIPKAYAEQHNIFPGDKVAFAPQKERTDFFGICKGAPSWNKETDGWYPKER